MFMIRVNLDLYLIYAGEYKEETITIEHRQCQCHLLKLLGSIMFPQTLPLLVLMVSQA